MTRVLLILAMAVATFATVLSVQLAGQVRTLNHACIPTYTGGGVTQCAQPNIIQAPPTP